jgi:hypothetical protein
MCLPSHTQLTNTCHHNSTGLGHSSRLNMIHSACTKCLAHFLKSLFRRHLSNIIISKSSDLRRLCLRSSHNTTMNYSDIKSHTLLLQRSPLSKQSASIRSMSNNHATLCRVTISSQPLVIPLVYVECLLISMITRETVRVRSGLDVWVPCRRSQLRTKYSAAGQLLAVMRPVPRAQLAKMISGQMPTHLATDSTVTTHQAPRQNVASNTMIGQHLNSGDETRRAGGLTLETGSATTPTDQGST